MTDETAQRPANPPRSTAVLRPPRPEMVRLVETLDACIGEFFAARTGLLGTHGWEAPREGWALSNLMVRNMEAVLLMARTDEVMVSAAWANARCVFEHAVRIIWLLDPPDRFTSECRWLGFLADVERFHRLVGEAVEKDPGLAGGTFHQELEGVLREFREGVIARLPQGYEPEKPPSFEAMLRTMDGSAMYRYYREGSQYVHGSVWGTAGYRKNFGIHAEFGEFSSTADWILPLRLCWLSLRNAGAILLDRLGESPRTCDWDSMETSLARDFEALVRAIAPTS
ncbi:DUF5677 domain-containing protein [Streptomyces sp. BE147]|uniref:DUF5677 domain-containing protein n=1 Tax=unclassified Streptomyces TaxID=2593676 RepID=UPI002E7A3B0E|nr:DUF5677 domain-containing protein [Streptomyces sp. BE147]MEE1738434.1 hypothetical protein [Streptomyces sp. BE147]